MNFSGEKAFEYMKKLAIDIGSRPSGTDARAALVGRTKLIVATEVRKGSLS